MLKNVLFVDDKKTLQLRVKEYFEGVFEFIPVCTENEARTVLEKKKVDIVILDYCLKENNSMPFLREIKQKYPNLPVIGITGFDVSFIRDEMIKSGAEIVVSKPFDTDYLEHEIKRILYRTINTETTERAKHKYYYAMKNAKEYLMNNCEKKLTTAKIADYAGLDRKTLNAIFKEFFEYSVNKFLLDFRIEKIRNMLEKRKLEVKEVFEMFKKSGLESKATFYRYINKLKNKNPK